MASQVLAADNRQPITERTARFLPGLRMLVLSIALLAGVRRSPCWRITSSTARPWR